LAPETQTELRGSVFVLLDAVAQLSNPQSCFSVFEIPYKHKSSIGLEDTIEFLGCLFVVWAPMEGLCDDNDIGPRIFDLDMIKVPFLDGHAAVLDFLGKDFAHAFTWLERFKRLY